MTATMIEAALRALLFALVVGAGLRLFRVSNVPARKAAWTLVLVASLAMPFLMGAPAIANWKAQWGWAVPIPMGRVATDTSAKPVRAPRAYAAPLVVAAVSGDPAKMTPADSPSLGSHLLLFPQRWTRVRRLPLSRALRARRGSIGLLQTSWPS